MWVIKVFIVLFGIIINAKSCFAVNGRIVGGEPAIIQELPYQISLQYDEGHFCGGTIYKPNKIITAGHCVYRIPYNHLSIYAGSTSNKEKGIRLKVIKVLVHPDYKEATSDYDIAVLTLERNLNYGPTIAPILLPYPNEPLNTTAQAIVSGWGHTKEGGSAVSELRKLFVLIVDQEYCKTAYKKENIVSIRMLCAGFPKLGGRDACQGDSGGPLVAAGTLIGIVSWGYGCARLNYPGVYTRVSKFSYWVNHFGCS